MKCYPCAFWHWPKVCPLSAVTYTLLTKKIVINMSENCKIHIYDLFLLFKRSKIWKFAGQNIMSLTANELVKYSTILIKKCVIPKFKYIAICNVVRLKSDLGFHVMSCCSLRREIMSVELP